MPEEHTKHSTRGMELQNHELTLPGGRDPPLQQPWRGCSAGTSVLRSQRGLSLTGFL